MESPRLSRMTALMLFVGLAVPIQPAAQQQAANRQEKKEHHRYRLVDIGTFGGPASFVNPVVNGGPAISTRGTAVGSSATAIPSDPATHFFYCGGLDGNLPFTFHAFDWQDGAITDLGALPPAVDNCSVALAVNSRGEIAGGSEDGLIDPLGKRESRAVLWKDSKIKDLGTFGGNHSQATALNDRGQIVGYALNQTPDPSPSLMASLEVPQTERKPGRFCGRADA